MPSGLSVGDRVHVVILAAGASLRLGTPKQLIQYEGSSLLRRAASAATGLTGSRVTVVLGAHSRQVEGELRGLETSVILNSDWREGLASSIRKGLLTLPPARQAALLMPCDLPLVDAATLGYLSELWDQDRSRIITCASERSAGLPAIVPRRYFKALMSIKGDPGIANFFARHRAFVQEVSLPATQFDIDSRTDMQSLGAFRQSNDSPPAGHEKGG